MYIFKFILKREQLFLTDKQQQIVLFRGK